MAENAQKVISKEAKLVRRFKKQWGTRYLFSVVVSVFNTARYLPDCIGSLLGQSIGFKHIQVILVDDGSTDGSANLCAEYQQKHSDNIVFVAQDHAGVSSARNTGMRYAEGAYLCFLDSDDKWSEDAFFCALSCFKRFDGVRAVAMRHWLFGAKDGPHARDHEFSRTRVVDIMRHPELIQCSMSNVIMEASLAKGREFRMGMKTGEDTLFISEVLLDEGRYVISNKGKYLYRKRAEADSATDVEGYDPDYFANCSERILEYSQSRYSEAILYAQYVVMYDLQWRLLGDIPAAIPAGKAASYRAQVVSLLRQIDDVVIVNRRNMPDDVVLYALALKYGIAPSHVFDGYVIQDSNISLAFHPETGGARYVQMKPLAKLRRAITIEFAERVEGGFAIEGHTSFMNWYAHDAVKLEFEIEGQKDKIAASLFPRDDKKRLTPFHGREFPKIGFRAIIPWDGSASLSVRASCIFDSESVNASIAFGRHTGISVKNPANYWVLDDAIIRHEKVDKRSVIQIEPSTTHARTRFERDLRDLIKEQEPSEAAEIFSLRDVVLKHPLFRKNERIWMVCDRPFRADDNGEALFRYLQAHPVPGVKVVFAIMKDAQDYARMESVGPVVAMGSPEYDRLLMKCDLFLSSSGDDPIKNHEEWLRDLYHYKYVFLQHGVIHNDLSRWLSRYNKNIKLFITSAYREVASILDGGYGYGEDVVALTGLPRYDSLVRKAQTAGRAHEIYVMPTWRLALAGAVDEATGVRRRNPNFCQSEYYREYSALIHDARLNALLERNGITMHFVMHPSFQADADCFTPTENVVVEASCDYQEAFVRASCLVTDYSSVAFDVAVLEKPIVYFQFDKEAFFTRHSVDSGYFSYENDGFGPVVSTVDEVVDELEKLITSGFRMDSRYQERVEGFFFNPQEPRCKLIVDRLVRLCETTANR